MPKSKISKPQPATPQQKPSLTQIHTELENLSKRIEALSRFCFFIREDNGEELYDFSCALETLLEQEVERSAAIAKAIGELAAGKGGAR